MPGSLGCSHAWVSLTALLPHVTPPACGTTTHPASAGLPGGGGKRDRQPRCRGDAQPSAAPNGPPAVGPAQTPPLAPALTPPSSLPWCCPPLVLVPRLTGSCLRRLSFEKQRRARGEPGRCAPLYKARGSVGAASLLPSFCPNIPHKPSSPLGPSFTGQLPL